MTDDGDGEIDHAFGNATLRQKIPGQDKKRDRHDAEVFDSREQLQRDRFNRYMRHGEQESQHRQAERN